MAEVKKNAYKYCIVPMCQSTTVKNPNKKFFRIPNNITLREKWCKVMKRDLIGPKSTKYVCEDHFDVENDTENLVKHRLVGGTLKLKANICPHKFDCQKAVKPQKERVAYEKRRRIETGSSAPTENDKNISENKNTQETCPSYVDIKIEYDQTEKPLHEIIPAGETVVNRPQTSSNESTREHQLLQLLAEKDKEIQRQHKTILLLQDKNRLLKKELAIALTSKNSSKNKKGKHSVSSKNSKTKPGSHSHTSDEDLSSPKENVSSYMSHEAHKMTFEDFDSEISNNEDSGQEQAIEDLVYPPHHKNKTDKDRADTADSTDPLLCIKEEPIYNMNDRDDESGEELLDTQFALSDVYPGNN